MRLYVQGVDMPSISIDIPVFEFYRCILWQ